HGSILYNPRRLSSWQAADALNVIFFDENSPKKHPIERIERLKKRALEGSCSFQYILAKACLFYRNEDFPLEDAFKYFLLSAVNRLPVAEFMVIFLLENGFGPQTPLGLHELIKSEILKNPKVSEVVLREFKECEETSDIKKLVEFARRKF